MTKNMEYWKGRFNDSEAASPFNKKDKNPYGFADARGKGKRTATNAEIEHWDKNPKRRGETTAEWKKRIGKPPSKNKTNVQGLPYTGGQAQS